MNAVAKANSFKIFYNLIEKGNVRLKYLKK